MGSIQEGTKMAATKPRSSELAKGAVLDGTRFRIVELIGRGAMGTVYRAYDEHYGRDVALKILAQLGPEELYILKREFRSLAGFSHPNLVQLYELIAVDEVWFFTMELLIGSDPLRTVRGNSTGPLDPVRLALARRIFRQLALGLRVLHASGQTHRDVKPSNAMVLPGGRAVLLDFGLAARLWSDGQRSQQSGFTGTLAYAAPEQAWGAPPSPASDWYSLGAMLYETLTGRLPFSGPLAAVLEEKRKGPPPRPSNVVPGLPGELDDIVTAMLEPEPRRRPEVDEIIRILEETTLAQREIVDHLVPQRAFFFVGRELELASLRTMLDGVRAGGPAVAHVRGSSGLGKTELVRRFLSGLEGDEPPVLLTGRCHPQESVPYRALDPLIDDLSRYLANLDEGDVLALATRHAGALLRLFPVLRRVPAAARWPPGLLPIEPQELRRQGVEALRDVLARIADRRPVVLWIDDAQWGDADSAVLLRALLRPPDAPRALLVLSYRREDAAGALLQGLGEFEAEVGISRSSLELRPLAEHETLMLTEQLLREARLAGDVDPRPLAAESGGSPFLLGEFVRYAAAHQRPAPVGLATYVQVADVVRARLESLESGSRHVLELTALSAMPLDLGLVLELAGIGPSGRPEIYKLCAHCLLRTFGSSETPSLEIYHDRIRDALLQAMSEDRRRQLHAQLAEGLRGLPNPDPQVLWEHHLGAGKVQLAAEYALQAASDAAEALAFELAARFYGEALRLRGDSDTDWGLQVRRAEALVNAGRGADAASAFEDALAAAKRVVSDRRTLAELKGRAAQHYLYSGLVDRGLELMHEWLGDLGISIPRTPAEARRSALLLRLRFIARGSRLDLQPVAGTPDEEIVRLDALHRASRATAMIDSTISDMFGLRFLLGAIDLGEPSRVHRAVMQEATMEAWPNNAWLRRRALRLWERGAELAERSGDPYDRGWLAACHASIQWVLGEWRAALESCEKALEIFRTQCTGVYWEINFVNNFVFSILYLYGAMQELFERMAGAIEDAWARGDPYGRLFGMNEYVVARLTRDDVDGAMRDLQSARELLAGDLFTFPHYHVLVATVRTLLYRGAPWEAWEQMVEAWKGIRAAGLLALDQLMVQLRTIRCGVALAAARSGDPPPHLAGWSRSRLARVARREERRLRRSSQPHAGGTAALVRASLAGLRGDAATQLADLRAAAAGFDSAGCVTLRELCRFHIGAVPGADDASRAAAAAAQAWMESWGAVQPGRLAAALMPGVHPGPPRTS